MFFDHVIVCTVTGSTHAGMVAGFALEDRADRHLIGIDASATLDRTVAQVTRIARDTAAKIGVDRDVRADEITIVDGYHAGTYGIPDDADDRRHPDVRTAGRDDHRSRLRGEVDGGRDRHDPIR